MEAGWHCCTFATFLAIWCPRLAPTGHFHCIPLFQGLGQERGGLGSSCHPDAHMLCVLGKALPPLWVVGKAGARGGAQMIFKGPPESDDRV